MTEAEIFFEELLSRKPFRESLTRGSISLDHIDHDGTMWLRKTSFVCCCLFLHIPSKLSFRIFFEVIVLWNPRDVRFLVNNRHYHVLSMLHKIWHAVEKCHRNRNKLQFHERVLEPFAALKSLVITRPQSPYFKGGDFFFRGRARQALPKSGAS